MLPEVWTNSGALQTCLRTLSGGFSDPSQPHRTFRLYFRRSTGAYYFSGVSLVLISTNEMGFLSIRGAAIGSLSLAGTSLPRVRFGEASAIFSNNRTRSTRLKKD